MIYSNREDVSNTYNPRSSEQRRHARSDLTDAGGEARME